MKPEELKKALNKAEQIGYDRGVKTIVLEILKKMDEDGMKLISYKSLRAIYEEYIKQAR